MGPAPADPLGRLRLDRREHDSHPGCQPGGSLLACLRAGGGRGDAGRSAGAGGLTGAPVLASPGRRLGAAGHAAVRPAAAGLPAPAFALGQTGRLRPARFAAPPGVSPGVAVTNRDRVKLLFGPYQAPALRQGDRAFCLLRDCDVVITSWSSGRIPWPRCRPVDGYHGGGWGLLLDEELARAVRHESAAAVCHWWGASPG